MVKLRDIIKTTNIIKISPDINLSSSLSKLSTSHDAGFVFTDGDEYLGVINPYYCLIKSSFPGNAKTEHCVFHAPKIKINFPITKVAQLLTESKIHYLPVFDENDKFIGIISARRLLAQFAHSDIFKIHISEYLKYKNKPIITIFEEDIISTALNIFKQTRVSKLIVINKDMKLRGILSYFDLISYLVSPKNSQHRGEREGNRVNFYNLKVKNFAKTYVLTLTSNYLIIDALKNILEKRIGSVVIVDKDRHPIGIITTKDLLTLIIRKAPDKNVEIISKNLSRHSRQVLGGFFNTLTIWLKKLPNLSKAKLFVKEEKKDNENNIVKVVLSLIPKKGPPKIIKKEGHNLLQVLSPINEILKRIRNRE